MAKAADILADAKEAFKLAQDAESENRQAAREDIEFALLADQWPPEVQAKRVRERRPCLTINMLPKFQRQVMNDIRQNRPAIKVRPADSGADVKTANVVGGIVRNIEQQSSADTAYDTAAEHAIAGGFGYWTVAVEYAYDDTFEQDIRIKRVANQFSIFGDPHSTEADSSDWNSAFQVEMITRAQFKRRYKGAEEVDWEDTDHKALTPPWREGEEIMIAGWWTREEVPRLILKLSDGTVVAEEDFVKQVDGFSMRDIAAQMGITVVETREAPSYEVKHCLMTGAEVLKETDWPGRYIPIVPVYGIDINLDGKRILKSLIRDARDPQINFNYWRTAATELIALAPKAPWVGPVGSFDTDAGKWDTANSDNHSTLEYDIVQGGVAPQRQEFAGIPAGALNQAMLATDDMKGVLGMFDASIGAKSNETSGKAILARQREGDVGTFHFADNLSRAIRHGGRIIVDLIPKVYSGKRMLRILGEDGKPQTVQVAPKPPLMPGMPMQQPMPGMPPGMPPQSGPGMAEPQQPEISPEVFDLTAGKYDLVVQAGPSFTTRREETAAVLTDIIRAMPPAASVLAPTLFKVLDVPGIEEIQEKLAQVAEQSKPPDPSVAKMAEVQANAQAKMAEIEATSKAKSMEAQENAKLRQAEQVIDAQIKQQAAMADAALKRQIAEQEMALKRWMAEQDAELEAWKAKQQDARADRQAERDLMAATEGNA